MSEVTPVQICPSKGSVEFVFLWEPDVDSRTGKMVEEGDIGSGLDQEVAIVCSQDGDEYDEVLVYGEGSRVRTLSNRVPAILRLSGGPDGIPTTERVFENFPYDGGPDERRPEFVEDIENVGDLTGDGVDDVLINASFYVGGELGRDHEGPRILSAT